MIALPLPVVPVPVPVEVTLDDVVPVAPEVPCKSATIWEKAFCTSVGACPLAAWVISADRPEAKLFDGSVVPVVPVVLDVPELSLLTAWNMALIN